MSNNNMNIHHIYNPNPNFNEDISKYFMIHNYFLNLIHLLLHYYSYYYLKNIFKLLVLLKYM
jgi:hypothetical protein